MMELKDISYYDYYLLEDKTDYDFAITYAKIYNAPLDVYKVGDFMELPFGTIKDIQYDISEGIDWAKFFDYSKSIIGRRIVNDKLLKICQWKSYFFEQMNLINEVESTALAHEPTSKEIRAGIDELNSLGVELQIRKLTSGDVTKKEAVRQTKYQDCFIELVAQKKIYDFNERLRNIKN